MNPPRYECIDGNEAAARIAYALSEVIAIYPITPASPMGEAADAWSARDHPNLWGSVPEVIEMQSEAGAAAAIHGAIQRGALATTFTASQGLLLMLPNMFKIAGELSPGVIHVAARTVATHALSIFGDHSDVMAARETGFAMLCSSSVQEAHDFALISHAASLSSWLPFLHFFDGFRTSHEMMKVALLEEGTINALVSRADIAAHRHRALSPDRPVLRGSAQNPDVFFQAREAANPFYLAVPEIVQDKMRELEELTGRSYHLVDYAGAPDAERVVVMMGSGAGAAEEAVGRLNAVGEKVGLLKVRLYRPFPADALMAALPPSVKAVAVLDRTKSPGATGEPLYLDVVAALQEGVPERHPKVIGGRFGLSSKEFTPAMAKAVLDELAREEPKRHFTVGIVDDVTRLSLDYDESFRTEPEGLRAIFYGLGSDGTVGANKNSVKIVGENTELFAQGYFVYDSKKAGSETVSHLRFSRKPFNSTYLVQEADFVGCHQFQFLERRDVLAAAAPGATLLLNSTFGVDDVWSELPVEVQRNILNKELDLYVIDAFSLARELGMGNRINTIMQTAFFSLSKLLPEEQALAAIKSSIEHTYGKRGRAVVEQNWGAVDRTLVALNRVELPDRVEGSRRRREWVPEGAPDFVERVTARLLEGEGDLLPVSALPIDGTFPTGTAQYEKRSIALEIPIWDPDICIDCGQCALVCPHAAIRMKVYSPEILGGAPDTFQSKSFRSKELPGMNLTIQVTPDDCTGCGVCVDICPAKSRSEVKHKAINMSPKPDHLEAERANLDFFLSIPELDRSLMEPDSIKGSQVRQPLFEFSGACAGCGETPYLKLLTQLFGDRIVVANATGCSSIYGGNLPTTPWTTDSNGRGPAWSNSLFEDNAEFGLGFRLALDRQRERARMLLRALRDVVGSELSDELLDAPQSSEEQIAANRARVTELRERLQTIHSEREDDARELSDLADELVDKSVWIVGGDGWAYDIGSAGLDHVLASGRDVNVLVLDTEVYSNTGGQASKATPRGAVAKFAVGGKSTPKKDLGLIASAYGNVYVAQVALGANYSQTIRAFLEAEAWPGPSLIIAYSTCIAHGIDMTKSMAHQKEAVGSGYWPLYRFHPGVQEHQRPFQLDSREPSMPVRDFVKQEARFSMLERSDPDAATRLQGLLQDDVDERWRLYSQLAGIERTVPDPPAGGSARD